MGITERVLQAVIAASYSLGTLGAFYLARQLMMAPAMLIDSALRPTLFANSARSLNIDETRRRVAGLLALVVELQMPLLVFCLFWMKPVLLYAAGEKWSELATIAWWYIIPGSTAAITSWLDRMFDLLGRQRLYTAIQLGSDLAACAVTLAVPYFGWPFESFIAALSLTIAATHFAGLAAMFKVMGFTGSDTLNFFLRVATIGAATAIIHWTIWVWVNALTGILCGTLVLLASVAVTAGRRQRWWIGTFGSAAAIDPSRGA